MDTGRCIGGGDACTSRTVDTATSRVVDTGRCIGGGDTRVVDTDTSKVVDTGSCRWLGHRQVWVGQAFTVGVGMRASPQECRLTGGTASHLGKAGRRGCEASVQHASDTADRCPPSRRATPTTATNPHQGNLSAAWRCPTHQVISPKLAAARDSVPAAAAAGGRVGSTGSVLHQHTETPAPAPGAAAAQGSSPVTAAAAGGSTGRTLSNSSTPAAACGPTFP